MTAPIRVLELLVTTSPGGGPKHVYDLVRHLPKNEFEIVVAGPRPGVFFERFQELGVTTVELPVGRLGVRPLVRTIRLLRTFRIDVVHSHGKGPGLYGRLAAWRAGASAVHTFHGIHYGGYPGPLRALYFALERALSRLSHTIINVSASQEAEGLRLGLFRPSQSVVIVNGIDLADLDRIIAGSPVRRESLGVASTVPVLGCVTRFDPVKRIDTLLRALRALASRDPRVTLVLVGGGGEEERIRRMVAELGLGKQVVFTGLLEEPARIYPALDLYVSTSLKEGLPLSLVEAMGAGRPVVATDVPGHRDVVVHGETGLLVPPEDPAALAGAISSLLADPERRRRMGEAGRRR
ncbi:MAG TPA: glycosyltransferase family 4 protein, partial [Methylomirabilota bacterium]|nr:glycosyltransferase family 4 protein [Methylomirabilota bacterium]